MNFVSFKEDKGLVFKFLQLKKHPLFLLELLVTKLMTITQKARNKKQIKQTVPYHEYLMNKLDVEDFSLENKLKDHNRVMN